MVAQLNLQASHLNVQRLFTSPYHVHTNDLTKWMSKPQF